MAIGVKKTRNIMKNIIVYGSGFAALVISCALQKLGYNTYLVSNQKNIGGVLNPISIFGREADIGPQFLENLTKKEFEFLLRFLPQNEYKNIGISYGSFFNNRLSSEFCLPILTHLSDNQKKNLINSAIALKESKDSEYTLEGFLEKKYGALGDLYIKLARKFLINDLNQLSKENYTYLEFGGRLRLYDDEQTMSLRKKDIRLDKLLAASRKTIHGRSHSLYPRKGNIGKVIVDLLKFYSNSGGCVGKNTSPIKNNEISRLY